MGLPPPERRHGGKAISKDTGEAIGKDTGKAGARGGGKTASSKRSRQPQTPEASAAVVPVCEQTPPGGGHSRDVPAAPSGEAPITLPSAGAAAPLGAMASGVDLARRARDAALGTPGVAGIECGPGVFASTYGRPGETVKGIRVTQDGGRARVEIHLCVRMVPLEPLIREVRRAIAAALSECVPCDHVDVWIDSLAE